MARRKGKGKRRKGEVKVTPTSVVFTLKARQRARAEKCLKNTGKITLGFREVEVTKLADLVNSSVIVN